METPFLHAVLESLSEGVFTVDRYWKITSFNRAAETITGISRQEAIARRCWDILRTDICKTRCTLRQTLSAHKSVLYPKVYMENKEGRSIPVSISTSVLKDLEGNVVGGMGTFRDLSAIESLNKEIARWYTFEDVVGKSHKIKGILRILPDIARSDSTVLIQGASGTGKELFARVIHNLSERKKGPFVIMNCGVLPDTLLEKGLFGYVKGALTNARKNRPGRFLLAKGGTILLDEIGAIPLSVQVKLLRVLQEKQYEPLGSDQPVKAEARIIATTSRDLIDLIRKGSLRDDIYYRISVVRIELPTLCERRNDIPLLVDHFVKKFNLRTGKKVAGASHEVMESLMNHNFPGNVRELENIIEHAFILCHGDILELKHLPWSLRNHKPCPEKESTCHGFTPRRPMQNTEAELTTQSLKKYGQ